LPFPLPLSESLPVPDSADTGGAEIKYGIVFLKYMLCAIAVMDVKINNDTFA